MAATLPVQKIEHAFVDASLFRDSMYATVLLMEGTLPRWRSSDSN